MLNRTIVALFALWLATGCSGASSSGTPGGLTQPSPTGTPVRVLMLTATRGFRHDSIPVARDVMSALAATSGGAFTVTATEDLSAFTGSGLAGFDVIFFALTTGELEFDAVQKAAIVSFVSGGKGFLGVHSATDTLYEWPDYGRLVGAYFKEHPWTQLATVIVEDPSHPATAGLGDRFTLNDEFYTFRDNPRPRTCCFARSRRSDRPAITRLPGASRLVRAARTTMRSATLRRRGETFVFSVS